MSGNPFRPFCSDRCRTIDLGNWISGTYRIPGDRTERDPDEEPRPEEDRKKV